MAPSSLWTPDGDITTHANVDTCTPREMEFLMQLHPIAQKLGLSVQCVKCGHSFVGKNASPNARLMSISCKCREIRAQMRNTVTLA